jgi:hypothetical protein
MVEGGHRAGFAIEAGFEIWGCRGVGAKNLDGDIAVEP